MKRILKMCSLMAIALLLATSLLAQSDHGDENVSTSPESPGKAQAHRPNILFIIMDDVGIDQLRVFGYGGDDPPKTPNIDAIAHAGVRFRNVWAMPECSPSRAIFFEGRFPLRTNVYGALLDIDLANSQVSPFEATTPKLLKKRGYDSGDFGKFHLGDENNNPFHDDLVHSLGWDYFDGFLEGAPHPIDETAGGVGSAYTCGFVPNEIKGVDNGGANTGSCRFVDNTCQDLSATPEHATPGRYCLEQGGVFVPNKTCQQHAPSTFTFEQTNGYYVWPRVINYPDGHISKEPYERGFVGEAAMNSAVSWINAENDSKKNWMATVAFPQIHTPYQQVPESLLPPGEKDLSNLNCTGNILGDIVAYHLLSNQLLESMDNEIGRLLVQTGLATYNSNGTLNYQPEKTNTMVVLIGDNGTYAYGVKTPFDASRAKAFVYQTGVWVPLIISGPLVNSPDREVRSMVNIADLYQLFAEFAGIDVRKAVPPSHILDSVSMFSYLTNPKQPSIRQTNFTQTGHNIRVMAPSPCVVETTPTAPATCVQLYTSQGLCEGEGGDWYGPTYKSCCEVLAAVKDGTITKYPHSVNILPDFQNAIRNDTYKLVQILEPDCTQSPDEHGDYPDLTYTEFYEINERPGNPALDTVDAALCSDNPSTPGKACPTGLTTDQRRNFNSLSSQISQVLDSEPACPGDGNEDKVVNELDIEFWRKFAELAKGASSWYDFNYDGLTNSTDLGIIEKNFGKKCLPKK